MGDFLNTLLLELTDVRYSSLAALLMWLSCGVLSAAETGKPNVLLIYADDLGYNELSCYGGKHVPTPNIDSIAANGLRMTQGYVSAPLCSPSRAGLMTGRYQTRFGHENNSMGKEGGLPLSETTLADRMKSLGYATCAVGKWHLGTGSDRLPMARGFDDYYGVLGNPGSFFRHRTSTTRTITRPTPSPHGPRNGSSSTRAARGFCICLSTPFTRHAKRPRSI
jgi:arylsulfatase A-like enzyme